MKWHFAELLAERISPWDVLSWSSSVEKADDYARLFYNHSETFEEDPFLCNCTEGYFGKWCEYVLLFNSSSFGNALQTLFQAHTNPLDRQEWGDILCYLTFQCDNGKLCLDWRNICDGQQNCMNGIDEENCDLLEFNECEDNEYRCLDGMCIAEEYWLDGVRDCMDGSDEKSTLDMKRCATEAMAMFCDDLKCLENFWSCGDGQCIHHTNRYIYQTHYGEGEHCFSMREFNHMCELAAHLSLWTKADGLCTPSGYNDTSLILSPDIYRCLYYIRCALSKGAEIKCPCNGTNCNVLMEKLCVSDGFYPHPFPYIIRPWLGQFYFPQRNWHEKMPSKYSVVGSFRCRGFGVSLTSPLLFAISPNAFNYQNSALENYICAAIPQKYQNTLSSHQYPLRCWNDSLTFNGRPYPFFDICPESNSCFSQYRIADGNYDCPTQTDEKKYMLHNISYCQNIRKHRFQCSSEQQTCLSLFRLSLAPQEPGICINNYDKRVNGHGRHVLNILCGTQTDLNECAVIRHYIGNSSIANSTFTDTNDEGNSINRLSVQAPFMYYCDTFWDLPSPHMDENREFCQTWICDEDEFRCRTGQCISKEWVCDDEWDCSDASDEFGLPEKWTDHNEHLTNDLNDRKKKCRENYMRLPFRNICHFDSEYPCYRASVPDPLNISRYRPCININQIGDGIVDCYGGVDEKNTLEDCTREMLGYTIRCDEGCVRYSLSCENNRLCTTSLLCSYKSKNSSWCSGIDDVVCLNGSCAKGARCDGEYQCLDGEDEHWCSISQGFVGRAGYRFDKYEIRRLKFHHLYIPTFPRTNTQYTRKRRNMMSFKQIHPQFIYTCNQGFPIYISTENITRCVCPPAYYGSNCQYFSDRISIITHLDLTTLPTSYRATLLTIVVHLHYLDTVIDHHIFHVNPLLELRMKNPTKHRFYLLYSRSDSFIKHKRLRYSNRTDIINHHPYSVHLDIFSLRNNQINELGSFHYPVYFDFLSAFRLTPVLRFPSWFNNVTLDPCASNPCNSNATCKPILNRNHSYYCSCKSGYSGAICENYSPECLSYCNSKSICRANFRGLIGNADNPLCICPLGHFGPRCYLENEACRFNPCEHNSTCHATYDPNGENPVVCVCSEQFFGDRCQYEKFLIQIRINMTIKATVSTVQFYNHQIIANAWHCFHQQIMRGVPEIVQYNYGQKTIPMMAIMKIYQELRDSKYFLLYLKLSYQSFNVTTIPEECPHALNLLTQNETNQIPAIFRYHQICKNDPNRVCFYDSTYFCLCSRNRAECFGHLSKLDECHKCLAGGRCVTSNSEQSSDFICICPHCTQGSHCEFSLQAFGFTFDSLLIIDTQTVRYIYISGTIIIFFLGFFNNYCSFATFKRPQPRIVGVGNYLLFVTILSQCSLFILLLKLISIVLGAMGIASDLSCKIISYLLSVSTRSTYWLTSWITINRLLTILYPTSLTIKKPRLAIYLSLGTLLVLLLMHIHEIFFYQTIQQSSFSISICVTNFHYPMIEVYNRVNTVVHYLLPFCIQIICTIYILIRIARSRTRTRSITTRGTFLQAFRKQLSRQKELFVTPIIIIFSALPQTILSFSLACSQLSNWQRHTLLVTILLSYVPQILGFILYVLPSSMYKKEFGETPIAKKMFKRMLKTAAKKDHTNTLKNKTQTLATTHL